MSDQVYHIAGEIFPEEEAAVPRLTGTWLRAARIAWVILAVTAAGIIVTSLPGYALHFSGQLHHTPSENPATGILIIAALSGFASLFSALLSLTLSWMFFRRRFDEPVAAVLSFYLVIYAVVMAGPLETWFGYWVGNTKIVPTFQALLMATPSVALFVLFPNGRFVPPWARWVLLLTIPWNLSFLFLPGFDADSLNNLTTVELWLLILWYCSFMVVGLYAQLHRYRHVSSPTERQQTKWVVLGFALWLTYALLSTGPYLYFNSLPSGSPESWWGAISELGWFLALNIVPVSLAIAVTRYRLWEIDVLINRTLVYGALTACVIGLYALVVGGISLLFQTQGNWLAALLATGLVAVLFQPLRDRLQKGVNRLIYGDRDDPVAVLSRLAERLETAAAPEEMIQGLVEIIAHTLNLPYAAVGLQTSSDLAIAAAYGNSTHDLTSFPLSYQGSTIGQLMIAPREPGGAFNPAEMALLASIARQAGTAVYAAQLTADLRRSRQRLVTAREEERRRLRRDLHDGLGPVLASLTLTIDAIGKLMSVDQAAAAGLLQELKEQSQTAVQDIRRLVYDLRPPALDDLGLSAALRESATRYRQIGVQFTVNTPMQMPPLPAAVEVAAYRIAQEAMTNVVRHAQARTCQVILALEQNALSVTVQDDGRGLSADLQPTLGLRSMRERAEELGGRFTIESHNGGGTIVKAELPLEE